MCCHKNKKTSCFFLRSWNEEKIGRLCNFSFRGWKPLQKTIFATLRKRIVFIFEMSVTQFLNFVLCCFLFQENRYSGPFPMEDTDSMVHRKREELQRKQLAAEREKMKKEDSNGWF